VRVGYELNSISEGSVYCSGLRYYTMTQPPLDAEESDAQAQDAFPSVKAIKALESYRKKEPLKSTVCIPQIS